LAQIDRANAAVRRDLLNRWFATPDAFERGAARGGQGFLAAVGLNVEYLRDALAALANKMEPQDAAEMSEETLNEEVRWPKARIDELEAEERLAAVEQETNPYLLLRCGHELVAALTNGMEPQAAAEIARRGAQRLAAALENPRMTDADELLSLGSTLATLANKMEPHAAAEIARRGAQRLAAALENPRITNASLLSGLGDTLAALANGMEPQAAAEIARRGAQRLIAVLKNPRMSDADELSHFGEALTALTNQMEPRATAEIAEGLAAILENPQETDSWRLLVLGDTLAVMANQMEPQATAEIAEGLAAILENPQETDSWRLSILGSALAALCRLLPSARSTQLLALSNMLLRPVSKGAANGEEEPNDRKLLAEVCAHLRMEDLAEVLKYPFCTGEAEQIVLNQLKALSGRDFGGNVWKIVEWADALGVKDLESPAKRPSLGDALKELKELSRR
jgi:hypothetical protein